MEQDQMLQEWEWIVKHIRARGGRSCTGCPSPGNIVSTILIFLLEPHRLLGNQFVRAAREDLSKRSPVQLRCQGHETAEHHCAQCHIFSDHLRFVMQCDWLPNVPTAMPPLPWWIVSFLEW
uniref:Uncharacterized protein n=1 Tax=Mus spicilegus TaxID=10103 RepID=A0A8C6IHT6_MUSSI